MAKKKTPADSPQTANTMVPQSEESTPPKPTKAAPKSGIEELEKQRTQSRQPRSNNRPGNTEPAVLLEKNVETSSAAVMLAQKILKNVNQRLTVQQRQNLVNKK